MKSEIVERTVKCAEYIVEYKATVRETAKKFGIGKSTVHTDVRKRLPKIDETLYANTVKVLETNLDERHIRGGESTRKKYATKNS
ncbi:MAG: sporulation transcriptional regulator SpoIIID [Clostridia bacterium]|nr:sporulation transcriptional regulator SpoIIID [Clostridia bacterium]